MSRRRAHPSAEELALWQDVARSVAPLRPKSTATAKADEPAEKPKPAAKPAKPTRLPPPAPTPKTSVPNPPALAPLDRRTLSRVNRGALSIDARIDLHGMTQAAAHVRLMDFIGGAQASGARLVLVITGKGKNGEGDRGILRRLVPIWLASPELRPVVVGFDEAGRAHGGAGALLVRLRRAQRRQA
jgi:DNA-nicking Smr family endonuclease